MKRAWLIFIATTLLSVLCFASEQQKSAPSSPDDSNSIITITTEKSFEQLLKEANEGDVHAQYELSMKYLYGLGITKDIEEGVKWLTKAAEQGSAKAQYFLALLYEGDGTMMILFNVSQDDNKAIKWCTKAAEQGYADAQYHLGLSYKIGKLFKKNDEKAFYWYSKAAEQGHLDSRLSVAEMYYRGEGVKQDYDKAKNLFVSLLERKYTDESDTSFQKYISGPSGKPNLLEGLSELMRVGAAQDNLGEMYYWGHGVSQDKTEAFRRFNEAVNLNPHGTIFANIRLGLMYDNGEGVVEDDTEAVKWYIKAAGQGYAIAQFNLGVMYDNGRGVPQDYKEAVKWYSKAAEQGDAMAQYNLGSMYANGKGVIEDYVEAYKWTLLAGMNGYDTSFNKAWLKYRMTAEQIAEAQLRAKEFVKREERADDTTPPDKSSGSIKAFGTGFFISQDGLFLTAAHVVQDAGGITVYSQQAKYTARTIFVDTALDIAILKMQDASLLQALPIASSTQVKTGDDVFTLGFPQVQLQGVEPKYTDGSISSLSGIGNDPKYFQISVPVQPGNSGGPLLNSQGQVVGLITARLDDINALLETGAIPQNVNYALKSSFILPLLESLPGVADQLEKPTMLDKPTAIEKAQNAVGLVVCME